MLIVVSFDTAFFSIFALSDFENLNFIIISGLISKGVFVIFYSILFYVYLKYFDLKEKESTFLKTKDVFKLLTFKQKFESAENEIKKAEEMYRILTDHSTDLICLHKPDSTFKYISPSIKNLLGYEQSEFLGKQVFDIIHNDDIQPLQEAIEQKVFSNGVIVDVISCRVRHKEGRFIWLEFLISPVYKEQEISYFVSTGRDVTERVVANEKIKNSLELLEKSEYSLSKASRMAKIGYWEYDSVTDLLTWSDYVYHVFGLDPKEDALTREEMLVFFDKNSQKKLLKATSDLDSKDIPYDLELILINRRKEEIWLRTIVQPVYNEQNEVIGRRGVLHNITESKKIQLELSTSLDLLEKTEFSKNKASKMAKIGYWEFDVATDTIVWSDSIYSVFGYESNKEIPSRNEILALYDKESQKKIEQANLELNSTGIPYDLELRLINLRKEEVWVRNVVQPIYNEQNEIVGRRGVFQDITLRKLRQDELDQKTEKLYKLNNTLNAAQELAHVGSWFHDFSSQKSEWSDETFRIWGFDPKKPTPDGDTILGRIHKDDLDIFNTATELVYSEGASYDIEYRICLDNDEVKMIRSICKPIFGSDGEVISLNGVNQDITEQKRRQDELDHKTEKLYELNDALNQAQKLSHIGSWQWNMATDKAEWSDEMYHIYGVTKENFYPSNDNVMKTVLPEDLHKLEKGLSSLLIDKMFVPFEFRIKRPSGEIRNLYIMALEKNSQENVFGVTKDITERKIIEEENLRIKNSYRSLFDNATISIWNEDFTLVFKEIEELRKLDIPNIKIYLEENPEVLSSLISKVVVNSVNKATLKLFKAKNSEDFFNNIDTTFGEGADKVFIKLIESIWTNKKSFTSEVNYKKLNGDEFVALFSIPIPQTEIEQKTIPISIQSIQNIKDAKSAERESIKDLNAAQEIAKVGSWFFNVVTKESEWSDETYRIWGFDLNEITPNEDIILNRIHIDDRELFLNAAELVYNRRVPYDIEYRICLPNDEEKWIRSICRPILDDKGNVVLLKGTNQDITEKKRASNELEKAEELYRLLTDNSNDIICLQEPDSTFKYMSPSIKKVLGYEPSEFIGKQIFSIIHNDDIQSLKDAIEQKVFSREITDNVYSFRARHKDGHFVWLEYLTSPVYIEKEISYFVTSARDITQRVEANEIIKTSLDLLGKSERSKNEASKIAKIGYWELDIATETFTWSDYLYQIYGLDTKDEIPLLTKIISLYDKESQEKIAQAVKDVGVKNSSYDLELKFTNLKNEEVWERRVIQAVYNKQNEIVGRRGVMQDITDSKKAQFELERSKKEIESSLELLEKKDYSLEQTSNIAKIGYWEYDIAKDLFTWSEYVYTIYGIDINDGIPTRKEMLEFYDKESQNKLAQATLDLNLNGMPYDVELKVINLRKEVVWVRNVVQPVYNAQNEIIGRRGVIQDITASKNAQFQLELSKKEIQVSLELLEKSEYSKSEASKIAEIGYWEHDFITDSVIWSDYVHYIFGSNPKDGVPGRIEVLDKFDKESQEKIVQATLGLTSKGIPYDIELYFVNIRNETVWIRNVAQPIYNEQNEIIGKRGVMQDITSSKNAQFELELSRQEIKTSLNLLEKSEYSKNEASKIAKIGYLEDDIATDTFIWSEHLYHIFGFDPKEKVPSRKEIAAFFDEESQKKMEEATLGLDSKGVPFDLELKLINLRKEEVWARIVVQPVYNNQNEIVGRRGVFQDITASKKGQIDLEISKIEIETSLYELERSEFTKNEASKIAKIGYWENDIATNDYIWSDYIYHIFGVDPKEEVPPGEEIVPLFDKESQERMAEALLELDSKGTSVDIELKLINFKNEVFWVRNVAQAVYNDQNEIVGRRGVTQDITASKKAQIELEISKQEIETSLYELEKSEYTKNEVSKVAKIGYWEQDIATKNYKWSDYVYRIFGLDPKEEVPSREKIVPLFDKESQEKMTQATLDLDLKGIPFDLELKLINLRNEEVWVRLIVQPIYNDQNEIDRRRGVVQDITASKNAQIELELSKQEIETSLYELEKSEYTKNEASKVAKIGYHEYDIATDVFIWSEYLYDIFGFDKTKRVPPREEIVPLFDEKSQKKMKKATLDLDLKGIPYDLELKITNLKNEEVWVRNIAEAVYNEQNEIVGRRGVTQNITISKNAQFEIELSKQEIQISLEMLGKSERSKNEASKMAKMGHLEFDIASDTFVWSDYLYEIFGFDSKKKIPPRSEILTLFDEESQNKILESVLELETNGTSYDIELKFINQRKEDVWARSVVQPVYNDQNVVIGRRGTFQNITASKVAQLALEASRQEIKTSLELLERSEYSLKESSKVAKIGYYGYDTINDIIIWSDYVYDILGFDIKDGVPSRDESISIIDKEFIKEFEQANIELISKGNPYDIELKIFNNIKKKEAWIRMVVQPVYNDQNEIVGRRGVIQDISDRKKIEEEHLRIKDNYRRLFENATISIWNEDLTDVFKEIDELRKLEIPNFKIYLEQHPEVLFSLLEKVKVNTVNKATLELFKAKDYQQFLGGIQNTFGKGAYKVFGNLLAAIWNKEKTFTSEVNFKTLEGEEFIALFSVSIPKTKLEQKSVPASIQSIQSIKDAELEKRKSIEKLKEAEKLANVGSWVFNISYQKSTWSEEMFFIWGFDLKKDAPGLDILLNRIHKDDLELFKSSVDKGITKGIPYDIEFRICPPNEEQKWIRGICQPVFGDNGDVIRLTGSNQDITEQKLATGEIEKAEEMYSLLTNNSNDIICLQELDSTFTYISPSIKSLLGYEQSDFLGKQIFDLVHKDDIQSLVDAMEQRITNGVEDAATFRVRHKQGHYIWLESLSSPVYKDNEISYFVTSSRDVTEWVLARLEIQKYQTSLQQMTTEMTLIEEKQKKEIASNIHDHLSQSLVISKMKINEMKKKSELKIINEDLKFIESHISEALENSRKITYELSPPVLYQLGIIDALNWLLEDVEATHKIECIVNSNVNSIKLSDANSILLYRCIQEVIKNAVKYANASLLTLNLDKNKLGINIILTDNGGGFDTSTLNDYQNHSGSGFGLFAVQERVKNIQGEFTITSKINTGTSVKIFIPLAI
ncbi:hypothetical protein BTO07_12800 [Polaribacter sp. SA4-12]|nr:hypothetical protein BTO07_12800 [Polaribacter sp. SA4-12]